MGLSGWLRAVDRPLFFVCALSLGVVAGALGVVGGASAQAPTEGPAEIVPPPVPTPRPPTALERVQAEHEDEIAFCLERERSLSADASGVVVIELRLGADGSPSETRVLSSTFAPGGVIDECVRVAVNRWTFPAPSEPEGARVSLTFVLGLASDTRPPSAAPREVTVSWEVRGEWRGWLYTRRLGTRELRFVVEEVSAGLVLYRPQLETCFVAAAEGRPIQLQLDILVPGGGDIGRDDVSIVGAGFDTTGLLRCIGPSVARIEARSTPAPAMIHWYVRIGP
jgi:hypothetical protein